MFLSSVLAVAQRIIAAVLSGTTANPVSTNSGAGSIPDGGG
jgi:hypothetical protein